MPRETPVVGAGPWGCPLWWLGKQAAKKLPQNRGASCTSMSGSWMPADMRRAPCAPMQTDTKVAKQPRRYVLTDVQLETLSIIAYRQPVTRAEIEAS